MFNLRSIKLISLALIALFWIVACTPQPPTSTTTSTNNAVQTQPLRVGTNPWSGYAGHHVAVKKGLYEEAGVKVEDIFFQTNSDQITAFLSGKLDASWMPVGDVIQMAGKDPNLKIIFLCDYSNGSDGIIARGINSPAELKGKTVAREDVLFEKVFLRAYLEKGGLTEKDIVIKDLPAPDAASAFSARRVDAAVTFEPFMTKAAKEGGGEVIFSTKDTNLIADVLVTRPDIITNRRPELIALLKGVDRGIKLIKASDPEAIAAAAEKLAIKPEELKEQLAGITLFDIEGNKEIGFNLENPLNAIKSFELVSKAAYDFKVLAQPLDVKTIYDDTLVKSL